MDCWTFDPTLVSLNVQKCLARWLNPSNLLFCAKYGFFAISDSVFDDTIVVSIQIIKLQLLTRQKLAI